MSIAGRTDPSARLGALMSTGRNVLPGIALSAIIAMAATFVSDHHGGPTLLYALLIGIAFYFLSQGGAAAPGIHFTARSILRFGVGLLGVRISFDKIVELGALPIAVVVGGVIATVLIGRALARPFGVRPQLGVLTGGAVAICGASAAMAIAAVLPKGKDSERDTLFTVIAVTILSTLAMILYPLLIGRLALSHNDAGILLGGTIHDVAQVVGAGYLVSEETGVIATYVKLLRVAMLLPVVTTLSWMYGSKTSGSGTVVGGQPLLPWFLVLFVVLAILNSIHLVPQAVGEAMGHASRWCLVCAIAALGMKTSLQELSAVGWRSLAIVVAETVFLLGLVLAALLLTRH